MSSVNKKQELIFKNELITLEQIYNFTCEAPLFAQKTNLEKIILFFSNIQDSTPEKKKIINTNNRFTIVINKNEVNIDLIDAPNFHDKSIFINWIFNSI